MVMVDATSKAVGGVLQQWVHDHWQPISLFSRSLAPVQQRYSTFSRELLAAYLAIRHFRYFVEGCQFTLFTDHKPLVYALRTPSSGGASHTQRDIRYTAHISEFISDVQHIADVENSTADALSRCVSALGAPDVTPQTLAESQARDEEHDG